MTAALSQHRRPPPRGVNARHPERLHLTGLTPEQREQVVLLVRAMRQANGFASRQDAIKAGTR